MTRLLEKEDICALVAQVGLPAIIDDLVNYLEQDYSRWADFEKTPRLASHYPHGVIELMPTTDKDLYSFKYVTGHPSNPNDGKLTVAALGVLAETASGYPLLVSEMTLLTAIRTAATSVFAARYLARPESETMALIGTGCQAEFQSIAFHHVLGIREIRYFDVDPGAMTKFARNLEGHPLRLVACADVDEACAGADIISTVTADKAYRTVISRAHLAPGVHINAVGGDCPGKTELAPDMLPDLRIAVEFEPQSRIEGEIQALAPDAAVTELWEIVTGKTSLRMSDDDMTLFDSVGFALEDFSTLRYALEKTRELGIGRNTSLIFSPDNPKDLFAELGSGAAAVESRRIA